MKGLIDLASEKIGGKICNCSDEFFAPAENLLKSGRGIFIEDKYTTNGKWMDGWESRRKRTAGNDWCIIKLGVRGKIRFIDIDTNHFLGNHPPFASIEGINSNSEIDPDENADWTEILPKSELKAGSQNEFEISSPESFTHMRLNIYPDGGIARLKVYGEVTPDFENLKAENLNLIAIENGAKAVACNDMFFSHMDNLLYPNRGADMGDGWETKRKRGPGNDWVVISLPKAGHIDRLLIDTCHFKGNFPDSASVEGINLTDKVEPENWETLEWVELLEKSKLLAHHEHLFSELKSKGPFTHLKLSIYPDGGISRFRAFGRFE